jgi:hypothetical protein
MAIEKIEVEVEGNWLIAGEKKEGLKLSFVFNAEPNVVERIQIKNEVAELLGGMEKVSLLETHAFSFFDKHKAHNEEKYGKEGLAQRLAEFAKLSNPKTEEEIAAFNKLYEELYKNQYYDTYLGLMEDRLRIGDYSWLKIMCISKPDGFEFFKQKEPELLKITGMVNERRKFFRQQTKEAKTTSDT